MKDLNFLKQSLIAHRGYHSKELGIPENSIPAFEKAILNNYIIELDVHILKDGNVVVFHDDNLKRMTGVDKKIKNTTYEEISKLKLYGTNYKIPLLKDVLELVCGSVPIIIELKYDVVVGKLESKLVEILNSYKGKYVVKSFSPLSVLWFRIHNPNIIRGQLSQGYFSTKNIFEKTLLKNMCFNIITKPDFVSYEVEALPNKVVQKFRDSHIVLGWTIKNQEQFNKGMKYCDNLICENFEKLKF